MKNLSNVIRSRAARFVSLRIVLILCAVMVVVGFGAASAWNGGVGWLNIGKAFANSKVSMVDKKGDESQVPNLVTGTSYPFTTTTGVALEDLSVGATGLVAANTDDTGSSVTNIGFDFFYDGVRFTQFSANPNGLCRLGSTGVTGSYDNGADFATTTNAPKIAPYYDDLWSGTNGLVRSKVIGSAPTRKLVVEWQNEQIPRVGSGSAGAGNFQMWLFETTGVIQFVYGSGIVVNSVQGGYTVGLQSGVATNFASVTTSTNTVSYATANNTQTDAIASGRSYIFTPSTPTAPTGLLFTSVTTTGMTLNWVDSANEFGYAIYRSTDGTNYIFQASAAQNATSSAVTGLQSGTTYFWKVYSNSEGALSSTSLDGSQATAAGTTYFWVGAGGADWNTAASWNTAADGTGSTRTSPTTSDILIVDGAGTVPGGAMTISVSAAASIGALQITNSTAVTIQSNTTTQRILTLTGAAGDDFSIGAGSSILLTSITNSVSIVFATSTGMTGTIAGTLTVAGANTSATSATADSFLTTGGTGTVVTVSSGGVINNTATTNISTNGNVTGSAATLIFANGSAYNVSGATSGAPWIPLATWGATSTVTITGLTGTTTAANAVQTFGNLTYNCSDSAGTFNFWGANTGAVVQGTLTVQATGSGRFRSVSSGSVTINNLAISAGTYEAFSTTGTVTITGNVTQTGGTFDVSLGTSAGTVKLAGNFTQSLTGVLTDSGSTTSLVPIFEFNGTSGQTLTLVNAVTGAVNMRVNNSAGVTLSGTLALNGLTVSSGNISGGTITYNASTSRLQYNSTTGTQTANATEFPAASGPNNLTINNTNASPNNTVTIALNRTLPASGVLTLTSGILVNTGNLITIGNTATGGIVGGSATTYVRGAVARTLAASLASGATYTFPIGKGTYNPFELVTPTTTAGTPAVIQAEAFDADAGGTAGAGMASLNTNRYWQASITANSGSFTSAAVKLTDSTIVATNKIAKSSMQTGAYDNIGGTAVVGTSVTSNLITGFSFFVIGLPLNDDMQATAFIDPTNGGTKIASVAFSPQASFSNGGLNTQTSVPVRYRICSDGTCTTELYNQTGTIASIVGGASTTVTFPSVAGGLTAGTYTIKAKSELVGDQSTGNDEITGTVVVRAPLSGTYTIGASQVSPNYTKLTDAIADLNLLGVSSAVTFELAADYASGSETYPLSIPAFTGASGTNTLTIKPASTVTATISGSVASGALIKLNGADFVTIDGSNSGGTDRSLTVTNTSTTSPTGVSLVSLGTGAGATNDTIKNCNISTGVNTATGYGIAVGGSTPGISGADNDNTTLQNNSITVATIGIYAAGTASVSTGGDDSLAITGNSVDYNGTLASIGIQTGNALSSSVSQNTVSEQTSASQSPTGISLETGFVSSSVTRNTISKALTTNSSGYGGRGITVGTGTASSALQISNNVIYGVNGSNYSSFNFSSSMGISIGTIGSSSTLSTTTGGINLYFNSVSMTGSMGTGSASAITAAIYIGSGTSALDMRDNVFANTQVGTSTTQKNYAVYSDVANTAFTTINYNDYFVSNTFNAGSAIPGFLTSDRVNLAGIQTGFGQNTSSITGDPLFNNPLSNLQPSPGSPVIDTGTSLSGTVTPYVDITGATRVDLPSMGAYETALDSLAPVISYTPLGNTTSTSNRSFTPVTVVDGTGVNTTAGTRPRVYYKKSSDVNNTFNDNTSGTVGWKYVEASGVGGSPFSFTIDYSLLSGGGGVMLGDTVQYFVVAQDTAPTPNVGINSGTFATTPLSVNLLVANFPISGSIRSYLIAAAVTGTKTVCSAGFPTCDYGSLTNVGGIFEAINNNVVTGDVVINITSDLTGETGDVALNQTAEEYVASLHSITIKPSGAARTVTSTATALNLITLFGADGVTIDGSLSGGTDQSLTLSNSNSTGSGTTVVAIISLGAGAGATNNTVKNTIIQNGAKFDTTTSSFNFGLYVGGNGVAAGPDNDNLTIQNNLIQRTNTAMQVVGATGGVLDNLVISDNTIGGAVAADFIGLSGMIVGQATGASITRNTVRNIIFTAAADPAGMVLTTGFVNSNVTRNTVTNLEATNTGGYGPKGISVETATATSNVLVANNFVYDVRGTSYLSSVLGDTVNGIRIAGSSTGGVNVYHNTVYLYGSYAGYSGSSVSAAFMVATTTAATLNVRDNIFVNSIDNTTVATDKNYSFYSTAANTAFTDINYNDYWVPVSSAGGPQVLGFISSDRLLLSDIQTGTTKDGNSQSMDPLFVVPFAPVDVADIHLSPGSPLLGLGTPNPPIVDNDFDNDLRDSAPDIGADEISSSGRGGTIPPGAYRDGAIGSAGLAGNTTFTGVLTLVGLVDANGFTLTIDCDGTIVGGSPTSYVNHFLAGGGIKKNFCTAIPFAPPSSFVFPVGEGGVYSQLDTLVTSVVPPSSLSVKVNTGPVPSPPLDANSLQRYWTITEVGDLTANLVMHYAQSDVPDTETGWRIIKVQGMSATSFPNTFPSPFVDDIGNTLTFNGVSNFSIWTAGPPVSPTSTTANVAGHVVDNTGAPLSGVTMTLLDTVLVENRTTVTDANGAYFFDAILTGREILVTPTRNGYTFNPQNRVFYHTGELTNADFTGTPDSGQIHTVGSDFDGDGKADLSVFRPSDATWYTLLSSTGVMKAEQWGLGTDRIVPADYDGDHKIDIAVFRPSTGAWYIHQSSTGTMRAVNWGLAEDVVTPADFDGDGQADIAVWRPSTGTWYIIESHNGLTRTVNWGTSGDRPVAADYDGDGKADMAVWRPSTGTWYVMKSSDGTYQYEHWGIEEDRPVVGDYDGDSKSDLAVFRPSTATWYVKLSSDSSTNSRAHGTAVDILTPGDYDGDGKTDRAVWQLGGDWNILRSATNTTFGQHWGTAGDIPTTSAYVP